MIGSLSKKFKQYLVDRANTLSVKGVYTAIVHSSSRNLRKSDILFWCHDNHRIAVVEGKKYAPLIDTIIDHLGTDVSSITLAGPFSKFYGDECYGNVVMYNRTLLFAYIYRFFSQRTLSIRNVENDSVVRAWTSTLKLIGPKVIIAITPSPELCIAARNLGIWIADMQHGILGPGNYYDLGRRASIGQAGWPDTILCWDQFSKDFIDNNLSPHVSSYMIGNPALFSKANKRDQDFNENKLLKPGLIPVLVTLTWHLPVEYADDKYFKAIGIPSALVEFIRSHGHFCFWNLRLHPAQITKRKDEVFQNLEDIFKGMENINWHITNSETIFDSFDKNSVHVTFDSASSREAAMKGIKTAVLDANNVNSEFYFKDLISENNAIVINPQNSDQFKNWIIESAKYHEHAKEVLLNEISERLKLFNSFIDSLKARLIQ